MMQPSDPPHTDQTEMLDASPKLCELVLHKNGIEEYIFHAATKPAIDRWIVLLEDQRRNIASDTLVRQILDTQVGLLPISYAMSQLRKSLERYPGRNPTRLAILYNNNKPVMLSIFSSVISALGLSGMAFRYFPGTERDEAIAWLLRDD